MSGVTLTENETRVNAPLYKYKIILQKLMNDRKYSFPFLEKVDPVAEHSTISDAMISDPMDFGTIFKRLEPEDEKARSHRTDVLHERE